MQEVAHPEPHQVTQESARGVIVGWGEFLHSAVQNVFNALVVTLQPTSVGAVIGRGSGAEGRPAVGGVKVSYGYAPDGLLLSRAPVGGQVQHVTWNRLAGISRMLALADTEFVYGLGQAPIVQTTPGKADSGGLVWLHTDRLGSVAATTDSSGGASSVPKYIFPSEGIG